MWFLGNGSYAWAAFKLAAAGARFTYDPALARLRKRAIRHHHDVEPAWRKAGDELTIGYRPRW